MAPRLSPSLKAFVADLVVAQVDTCDRLVDPQGIGEGLGIKKAEKILSCHARAGVSSVGGLDDGLLVCTLLSPKLKLIMSYGVRFYFKHPTKTTPYPKGLGLNSPWVLSSAAVLVGCWL